NAPPVSSKWEEHNKGLVYQRPDSKVYAERGEGEGWIPGHMRDEEFVPTARYEADRAAKEKAETQREAQAKQAAEDAAKRQKAKVDAYRERYKYYMGRRYRTDDGDDVPMTTEKADEFAKADVTQMFESDAGTPQPDGTTGGGPTGATRVFSPDEGKVVPKQGAASGQTMDDRLGEGDSTGVPPGMKLGPGPDGKVVRAKPETTQPQTAPATRPTSIEEGFQRLREDVEPDLPNEAEVPLSEPTNVKPLEEELPTDDLLKTARPTPRKRRGLASQAERRANVTARAQAEGAARQRRMGTGVGRAGRRKTGAGAPPLPGLPKGAKWIDENTIQLPDGRKLRRKRRA
ncbi:MAG: hypothetical protein U9Q79_08975, partial [Candidatus Hydrogenedentes bacterium]|nr:hypothetical protein [Candidatus Hydrogenedentota bacterium]